jgi:hypothetical protein
MISIERLVQCEAGYKSSWSRHAFCPLNVLDAAAERSGVPRRHDTPGNGAPSLGVGTSDVLCDAFFNFNSRYLDAVRNF